METTKQGHERALQNIKNAQSVLSIIEAGQQKQIELLIKMKLKINEIRDPNISTQQRQSLIESFEELETDVNNIRNQITFNGQYLVGQSGYQPGFEGDGHANDATITLNFKVGSGTSSHDSFTLSLRTFHTGAYTYSSTSSNPVMDDASSIAASVDAAMAFLSETGSAIERLQHKEDMIRSQITASEAVQSNYEDADFAKEQMELMKVQILQQTATAALAQANSAPQSVLSLFR